MMQPTTHCRNGAARRSRLSPGLVVAVALVLIGSAVVKVHAQTGGTPNLPTQRQVDQAVSNLSQQLDLRGLAAQYERLRDPLSQNQQDPAQAASEREVSGVMLFVSLGMPAASLDRIIDDAIRLRAPLILRGVLEGSLRATRQRIAQLQGKRQASWQIDPMLFRRFEVHAVPALVLVDPQRPVLADCSASSCTEPRFSKVSGDVSAGHALQSIAQAEPALAPVAGRYAALLRKEPR